MIGREEKVIILIILINLFVTALYLLWGLVIWPRQVEKKKQEVEYNRTNYIIKAVVMFLCPLVGPLFLLAGQLFYYILFRQSVDLEDVIFSKDRVETHLKADEERGRNMVSIEEAIAISDKSSLRTLMMNVIKGKIEQSLAAISLALNSEDSEASHYAASVLRDELNDFRATVQNLYNEIQKEDDRQEEYLVLMIDYMNRILVQNVFTSLEQSTFVYQMEEACEILYAKYPEQMTSEFFEWISLRLLAIKDYEKTEKWSKRGKEEFPKELSSYTCLLKLYFTINDRENFFSTMDELKKSTVIIDSETLELIRIFS